MAAPIGVLTGRGGDYPICIDGRMLGTGTSGVANYAVILHQTLSRHGLPPMVIEDGGAAARRADWRKRLAAIRPGRRSLAREGDHLVARDIFREAQVHFDIYGHMLVLDAPIARGLVHWTYPVPLRVRGWRNLYTVHDAIPLLRPDLTSIPAGRHTRMLDQIARHADRLVTVSEASRCDIAMALRHPIDRIANLSQAVDVKAGNDPETLPKGLEPGRYFIAIGAVETRKNIDRLLEAHAMSGTAIRLAIVGQPGWGGGSALARAATAPNVVLLPPQPRSILMALMEHATALLFPSLAEGFGLPIAEAMALGVPVLTSAGGAPEETAGGAALLIDPLDIGAMARAITSLGTDAALRQRLRQAGLERATAFGVAAYAERLRALYLEVVNG